MIFIEVEALDKIIDELIEKQKKLQKHGQGDKNLNYKLENLQELFINIERTDNKLSGAEAKIRNFISDTKKFCHTCSTDGLMYCCYECPLKKYAEEDK